MSSTPITRPLNVAPPSTVAEVHFDDEMEKRIAALVGRYPTAQAALLPTLWLCQERWGWISPGMISAVAERLGLSPAFANDDVLCNSSTNSTGNFIARS